MQELETVLAAQTPAPPENTHLFELPPLLMDGIPTPLEKMTQVRPIFHSTNESRFLCLLFLNVDCPLRVH